MSNPEVSPLFLRVTVAEMRQLDLMAVQAMRSRANYIATKIAAIISGTHEEPVFFPEAAAADESLVLFVRVPVSFKQECQFRAKAAEVPLSRWLRAALFSDKA